MRSGRPISQWTGREIAEEIERCGIVAQIFARHAARVLKRDLKPHGIRYWLTPPAHDDERFDAKVADV